MKLKALLIGTLCTLAGCNAVTPEQYKNETPTLRLEDYFNGPVEGWGYFQNRSGVVSKRFKVVMSGQWQKDRGVLDEKFYWSDGTESSRVWTINIAPDGSYSGTASDVVGESFGSVAGNAMQWRYQLQLPVDGKTYKVSFDDWMYLQQDGILLNHSKMSKWGFHLGDIVIAFRRVP